MTDIKSWIQSKTIWMVLVSLTPTISKFLGFDFGATMDDVLTVAGAIGAIYFRIKASAKLQ
jgi:uncharacterized membrane protein